MQISFWKIFVFFAFIILSSAYLYPRDAALGEMYLGEGRYQQALEYFTRVFEKKTASWRIAQKLAECYVAIGQPRQAIAILEKIRELRPGDWRVLVSLGELYESIHDYDRMFAAYEGIYQILTKYRKHMDHSDKKILEQLFHLAMWQQRFVPAKSYLEKLFEHEPEEPAYQKTLLRFYLADREVKQAKTMLFSLVKRDPKNLFYRDQLIALAQWTGDSGLWLSQVEEKIKLEPKNTEFQMQKVYYYVAQKQLK